MGDNYVLLKYLEIVETMVTRQKVMMMAFCTVIKIYTTNVIVLLE